MKSPKEIIDNCFRADRRLPDQVFRQAHELGYLITDSALLTAAECWPAIQAVARESNDERVVGVVLEDLRGGGEGEPLQVLDLRTDESMESFKAWLRSTGADRVEPLYIDARVIGVAGGTGEWGLWFEQDREMAVVGAPIEKLPGVRESLHIGLNWRWFEPTQIDQLLGPAFYPREVPSTIIRALRRSYSTIRTLE